MSPSTLIPALVLGLSVAAVAQPDPSGIEFVAVGAPGNAAWTGGGFNNNRGAVGYEFRIGKFEVTTAQWAEFMNAALDRPNTDRIPHVFAPLQWGATSVTPQNPGGRRYTVAAGQEMIPTGGVDWRTCAIYANWLHHDKSTAREAFLSGAYDVSTFGYIGDGGGFTDQLTRSPGARYWIPSLDEWMKASHYSPTRPNPDGTTGGWYQYSNNSDLPLAYGPPGVRVRTDGGIGPDPNGPLATANAIWDDFDFPGYSPYTIPLGSYQTQTPWNLLDAAGGVAEWTEGYFQDVGEPVPRGRYFEGSGWAFGSASGAADRAGIPAGSDFPSFPGFEIGLRVATSIPSASPVWVGVLVLLNHARRLARPRLSQQKL